jgi:phosphohistidine phosphatase
MNLYLMRHAIAVDPDGETDDSLREVTEKGRKRLVKIARNLEKLEFKFDLILTSPFLRARQTADVVAHVLGIKQKVVFDSDNLVPSGSIEKLVEEINSLGDWEDLLLVGHEPLLSQMLGLLVSGDASLNVEMKKAGMCLLTLDRLIAGKCATLEWLVTPAQLMMMKTDE